MSLTEKAKELVKLYIKKKEILNELDGLELTFANNEKELYRALISEKIEELIVNGYTLRPILKFSAVVKGERTIRVMRRRGYKDLVKPTIHPSTVHAFIRKIKEQNNGELPQWVQDNFQINNKETISIRKA